MDSRKKKIIAVLCVGSVILLWRLYALTQYLPSSAQADPAQAANVVNDAVQAGYAKAEQKEQSKNWKLQQEVASQAWGRNPFADVPGVMRRRVESESESEQPQLDQSPPSPPSVHLTGVSKSGGQWLAVVDGQIVRVGDVLQDEFTVTEITKRSVTATSRGWSFRFEIGAEAPSIRPVSEEP